jgi:hypothetical protein
MTAVNDKFLKLLINFESQIVRFQTLLLVLEMHCPLKVEKRQTERHECCISESAYLHIRLDLRSRIPQVLSLQLSY